MKTTGKLRAWIERQPGGRFMAGFVGVAVAPDGHVAVANRAPATYVCRSPEEAREWVEDEATAFGLPVEWVESRASSL
jgi:hypothetical protein